MPIPGHPPTGLTDPQRAIRHFLSYHLKIALPVITNTVDKIYELLSVPKMSIGTVILSISVEL